MSNFLNVFLVSVLFITLSSAQTIIYVDADATAGANTGANWDNAFTTLQPALDVSNGTLSIGTYEIWVAEGTYFPTVDNPAIIELSNKNVTFYIKKDTKVYGGFNATETMLSQRDYGNNVTILSGDLGIPNDSTDNAYHVMYIDGSTLLNNITNNCIIDGFRIEKGNADGTEVFNNYGGAIFLKGSGGGNECSPSIVNCDFISNDADIRAGAIMMWANVGTINATITNCSFYHNTANIGGAIMIEGIGATTNPLITNSTFSFNQSSISGGAMNLFFTSGLKIENCIFWKNISKLNGENQIQDSNNPPTTTINYSIIDDSIEDGIVILPPNIDLLNSANNLDYDPYFVDAAIGDLRLQSHSPAIESGNNMAAGTLGITLDLDGKERISSPCSDTKIDMGAYERQFEMGGGYTDINTLHPIQTHSQHFITKHSIESDQLIDGGISNPINISYEAGKSNAANYILLLPNFEVKVDMIFHAFIEGCL